jgi:hypothetical protein
MFLGRAYLIELDISLKYSIQNERRQIVYAEIREKNYET